MLELRVLNFSLLNLSLSQTGHENLYLAVCMSSSWCTGITMFFLVTQENRRTFYCLLKGKSFFNQIISGDPFPFKQLSVFTAVQTV